MPIINATIKTQIVGLLNETKVLEQEQAADVFAQRLADLIENALKSATVTIQAGIPVSTTGGAGATTGPGTGSLS